ncbi:hypothetical protein SAMN05216327_11258 [Dyadobacter sp. SG02]|uniref:hypothetical protein n=1 Tax=Dyadobacter sp. SG02 TaxID=1855291 RepID=UPI0008B027F3|nr:hypothetical protein [Dyadobacter sp. SG02]SEJ53197.1 hypothetical protein SAMN05216327_11258 [Dyadobacter sp. SG02]
MDQIDTPNIDADQHPHDLDEYKQLTTLFQGYLNLTVTTLNYTLLLAGGSTAYFLNQKNPESPAKYGLWVPAFICYAIALGFYKAIPSSKELTTTLHDIKGRLRLQLAPHSENLTKTLSWSSVLLAIVGTGIVVLFWLSNCHCLLSEYFLGNVK